MPTFSFPPPSIPLPLSVGLGALDDGRTVLAEEAGVAVGLGRAPLPGFSPPKFG